MQKIFARLRREEGQTMAEYAVILALITALVVGAIGTLRGAIIDGLTTVAGLI